MSDIFYFTKLLSLSIFPTDMGYAISMVLINKNKNFTIHAMSNNNNLMRFRAVY